MNKGMSQTLALIVAASVLMMTALTVIFLTQGSLTGIGEQSTWTSCSSTVESQCDIKGDTGSISVPAQCIVDNPDGASNTVIDQAQTSWGISSPQTPIDCSQVN